MTRLLPALKTLLLLLTCLVLPSPVGADGQSSSWRIAYEVCGPLPGPSGYETVCGIYVSGSEESKRAFLFGAEPVWSPDGLRLALADGNIYAYTFADGRVTQLTTGNASNGLMRWSPDGAKMAFVSNRDGAWDRT